MFKASIAPNPADGIFVGTEYKGGKLRTCPEMLASTYPLDSSWQQNGAGWIGLGDTVTITNDDSNNTDGVHNNFLTNIYNIDQSEIKPVTFRLIARGEDIEADSGFKISLDLTSGEETVGSVSQYFPAGTWTERQFEVTVTPTAPAEWLYAYILTRYGTGTVVMRVAEVFQEGDSQRTYGQWLSPIYDLAKEVNLPITQDTIDLTHASYYYEDISNVDGFDSAEHSIDVLSEFSMLVCREPSENTTDRQQYVQQQLVLAGVDLFGYANAGVSEVSLNGCHPQNDIIIAIMDRCAAAGYAGVFYDAFGIPGVPMEQMNALIDYAHSVDLIVIGNCHPQDVLNTGITTDVTPAPTAAPVLTATGSSSLAAGEYRVCWTRTSYVGETTPSPIATITIDANQGIEVSGMSGGFDGCYGINIYMSDAADSSTLRLKGAGTYGDDITFTTLPPGGAVIPPISNTAYVGNHLGIESTLSPTDWLLWESFYSRSDDEYDGSGGFADKFASYAKGMQLAAAANVKVMALAYALSSIPIDNFSDMETAYILTAGLGLQGFAYTGQSLSDTAVNWRPSSFTVPKIGSSLITPFAQVSPTTYEAVTDQGILHFIAVDNPISRSSAKFKAVSQTHIDITIPPVTADEIEVRYFSSADGQIWNQIPRPTVSERYFRFKLHLRNNEG